MNVHHIRSCQKGTVHGSATLVSEEDLGARGTKQVWNVEARTDTGDTMSTGTFTTHIVPLDYLEKKNAQ